MRPSLSVYLALLIVLGLAVWMYSGLGGDEELPEQTSVSEDTRADGANNGTVSPQPIKVAVQASQSTAHARRFDVFASTEASDVLALRAETGSPIAKVHVKEGDTVKAGSLLITLKAENRPQRLEQARAELAYRDAQWKASKSLSKKQFSAEVNLARDKAALASAKAALRTAEIEMARLKIKAPLDGVVEDIRHVSGEYVRQGDVLVRLYALDPLVIKAHINENLMHHVAIGQSVDVTVVGGTRYQGVIRHIAADATSQTRTFAVEVSVPNPEQRLRGGMTAQVAIIGKEEKVHFISPALLTLNDAGQLGVKTVDEKSRVRFYPVRINDESEEGMYITGLPDAVRIIIMGQGYVKDGQKVIATRP